MKVAALFHIPNYKSKQQVKNVKNKNSKGGGLLTFTQNLLNFPIRDGLNENTKNIESLSLEVINKNSARIR